MGVEVEGGRIVPIMDAEAQARAHAVFTTAADHQRRADIRIYYREGESGDWQAVETLVVGNIADCRAGEPDIDFYAEKAPDGSLILKTQAVSPPRRPLGKAARCLLLLFLAGALALAVVFLLRPAPRRPREAVLPPSSTVAKPLVRTDPDPEARVQPAASAAPQPAAQLEPAPVEQPAAPASSPPAVQLEPSPAPQPTPQPAQQVTGEEKEYLVQWGDTLWRITESYYGDRSLYPELAERNLLADPDLIISGQSLFLPPKLGPGSLGGSAGAREAE